MGKAAAVFADMDPEAEGEEGRLVPVARAVKAEPTSEVPAPGPLPDVGRDTGGPPPEIAVAHSLPLAGLGTCIIPLRSRAASLGQAIDPPSGGMTGSHYR